MQTVPVLIAVATAARATLQRLQPYRLVAAMSGLVFPEGWPSPARSPPATWLSGRSSRPQYPLT